MAMVEPTYLKSESEPTIANTVHIALIIPTNILVGRQLGPLVTFPASFPTRSKSWTQTIEKIGLQESLDCKAHYVSILPER